MILTIPRAGVARGISNPGSKMLKLTRRAGEEIHVPQVNLIIRVTKTKSGRVELVFDAPPELAIVRGEALDASHEKKPKEEIAVA